MKILTAIIAIFFIVACKNPKQPEAVVETEPIVSEPQDPDEVTTYSGLKYTILKPGRGMPATEGDEVLFYETTTYLDGSLLYTNEGSGSPAKILLGGNQATQGVDEGLRGMQVGEIRRLILTPQLARRTEYPENISPDSAIVVKIILDKIIINN
ncbi:MAG: FKBP-type peptidyl-prolyl cis-trans isomerase [Saprospiraceae bacterium]